MSDYKSKVQEARKIVRRSEEDQWRLAELTWQAVNEDGKTQTEWAQDIGTTQPHVSYLLRIHERYNRVIDADRPRFADAYAEAKGLPVERSERREMEALSNIRKAPPTRRAEVVRELLADEDVATAAASDPATRTSWANAQQHVADDLEERRPETHQAANRNIDRLGLMEVFARFRIDMRRAVDKAHPDRMSTDDRELALEQARLTRDALDLFITSLEMADADRFAEALAAFEAGETT